MFSFILTFNRQAHSNSIFFKDFKGYRKAVYQVHGKALPFTKGTYTSILLSSGGGPWTTAFPDLKKNVIFTKSGLSVYLGYNASDSEYSYYHNSYLERRATHMRIGRYENDYSRESIFVDKVRRFRELEVMQHFPG
jgi:hypothetical protein